jgi:uncharacterized protein (TIGR02145 family)
MVVIGGNTWMAENLNYQVGKSWCYDNNNSKCNKYGRLYDWNTAKTACPSGWHLPSRQEWNSLVSAAGGDMAGKKLKAKSGWDGGGNGVDSYGFHALPGGYRFSEGHYVQDGSKGYWWTVTTNVDVYSYSVYIRSIEYDGDYVNEDDVAADDGRSVRCIQGATQPIKTPAQNRSYDTDLYEHMGTDGNLID